MYYPSSENKGADQLRGYREADLRLCFRICRMLVFSWRGSCKCVRHHMTKQTKRHSCSPSRASDEPGWGDFTVHMEKAWSKTMYLLSIISVKAALAWISRCCIGTCNLVKWCVLHFMYVWIQKLLVCSQQLSKFYMWVVIMNLVDALKFQHFLGKGR